IIGFDIARRLAGVARAHRGPREQARTGADRRAHAGIAAGPADDGAQRGATQGSTDAAARLLVTRRVAGRGVAGTRRRIAAAEDIAITLRIGGRLGARIVLTLRHRRLVPVIAVI